MARATTDPSRQTEDGVSRRLPPGRVFALARRAGDSARPLPHAGDGVALVVYALFALTFAGFGVRGDSLVYFNLLRRFFGERPDFAFAYQFGSDVWNWPFFLVGKGLQEIFGQPRTFHAGFEEISITVATQAAFLLTLYLGWRLLRALDLPRGPAVLFLAVLASAGLLAAHSIWGFWDGVFSFSSRFLTALFPLFLIGVAELRRRAGAVAYVPLTLCVAWSLMLALVHVVGYDGITARDGVGKTVSVVRRTHDQLQYKVRKKATNRWGYLWALTQGRDPQHVNGP